MNRRQFLKTVGLGGLGLLLILVVGKIIPETNPAEEKKEPEKNTDVDDDHTYYYPPQF